MKGRCVSSLFLYFVVRQGCLLAQSFSNTFMGKLLVKVGDLSLYGVSISDIKIVDLLIGNDAVHLAESLEVLMLALEILYE